MHKFYWNNGAGNSSTPGQRASSSASGEDGHYGRTRSVGGHGSDLNESEAGDSIYGKTRGHGHVTEGPYQARVQAIPANGQLQDPHIYRQHVMVRSSGGQSASSDYHQYNVAPSPSPSYRHKPASATGGMTGSHSLYQLSPGRSGQFYPTGTRPDSSPHPGGGQYHESRQRDSTSSPRSLLGERTARDRATIYYCADGSAGSGQQQNTGSNSPAMMVVDGGTVRLAVNRDESGDRQLADREGGCGSTGKTANKPAGSHRVLLKLRRLSGPNPSRPKSVPDLSDIVHGAKHAGDKMTESLANDLKRLNAGQSEYESLEAMESAKYGDGTWRSGYSTGYPAGYSSGQPSAAGYSADHPTGPSSRVKQSKSMHHFYEQKNRTWNQNSLRHVDYEEIQRVSHSNRPSVLDYYHHNYENVYMDDAEGEAESIHGIKPRQSNARLTRMTQSPRSLRTRRSDFLQGMTEDTMDSLNSSHEATRDTDNEDGEAQPRRKARSRLSAKYQANKSFLYRSKSCERPRVKDTMRETFRFSTDKLQNNLTRFSNNISDKLNSFQASSRMSTISTGSTGRQSTSSSDEGKPHSPASWDSTPPPSILQSVAYKAIPCVELQTQCKGGRVSPTDSIEYTATTQNQYKDVSRPALSLAHRMRGKLHTVNKKISMIRSRSAERFNSRSSSAGSTQEPIPVRSSRNRTLSTSSRNEAEQVYEGPFIGHARAIVDYTPSPYDRDALSFKKDDVIDIISMNASGLWRGRCHSKVGNFKFINVEILPHNHREGRKSRTNSLNRTKNKKSRKKARTVHELLKQLNMEEHIPVFVLNGYENITLFQDLDDAELDYLGITDNRQRTSLLAAAESLFDSDKEDAECEEENTKVETEPDQPEAEDQGGFSRSFLRDSGCYDYPERVVELSGQEGGVVVPEPVEGHDSPTCELTGGSGSESGLSESLSTVETGSVQQARGRSGSLKNVRNKNVTSASQAVMRELS